MSEQTPHIDFLDLLPSYPDMMADDFHDTISRKREFASLRLDPAEDVPAAPGDLMKHQQFVQRFMSAYTPYDKLILFHDVGTGKTCSAVGAAEAMRMTGDSVKRALVVLPGPRNIATFRTSLAEVCTHGQYIPATKPGEVLTADGRNKRMINLISKNYEFITFMTLAKLLRGISDAFVKKTYSNRMIIIDEAHNIRTLDDVEPEEGSRMSKAELKEHSKLLYEQIHRLLHLAENTKIILMTATPMADSPGDLASLLNLLLPSAMQLPYGDEFLTNFMTFHQSSIDGTIRYSLNEEQKRRLKAHISSGGIAISRVRGIEAQRRIEMGEKSPYTEFIYVYPATMSPSQTEGWNHARDNDKSYLVKSRQASLFVYPDGTYGRDGFKKHIELNKTTGEVRFKPESIKRMFPDIPAQGRTAYIMKMIKIYSSTMHSILYSLFSNFKEVAFVNFDFVDGGAYVLAAIMNLIGFTQYHGDSVLNTPGNRFAMITGKSSNKGKLMNIMKTVNSPANKYGELCKMFIGSRVAGQSFSLFNIRQVHITALWNDPRMEQAIGRAFRGIFSHAAYTNEEEKYVKVYRHAAIPDASTINEDESFRLGTDIRMYRLAEAKEVGIRHNIQVLEEMAVDCFNNVKRNRLITDENFSKQCNFQKCEIQCDNISRNASMETIDDSYLVYYRYGKGVKVQEHVSNLLTILPVWTFDQIKQEIDESDPDLDIIPAELALSMIDLRDARVKHLSDFLGRPRDLSEFNDWFMLTPIPAYLADTWYIRNEPLLVSTSLSDALSLTRVSESASVMTQIYDILQSVPPENLVEHRGELTRLVMQLPKETQASMIESALTNSFVKNPTDTASKKAFRIIVIGHFKQYINANVGDIVISTFWTDGKMSPLAKVRCMSKTTGKWDKCKRAVTKQVSSKVEEDEAELIKNPYGLFGTKNAADELVIRDFRTEDPSVSSDKRKIRKRVCGTMPWVTIMEWCTRMEDYPDADILNTSYDPEQMSISDIFEYFRTFKVIKNNMAAHFTTIMDNLAAAGDNDDIRLEKARRIVRWFIRLSATTKISRPDFCILMESWLRKHGLMLK